MHDIKAIRADPNAFDAALAKRGMPPQASVIVELDSEVRRFEMQRDLHLSLKNEANSQIGLLKSAQKAAQSVSMFFVPGLQSDAEKIADLKQRSIRNGELASSAQAAAELKKIELKAILGALPNLPAGDVPEGADEAGNMEQKHWGTPREGGQEHDALALRLGWNPEASARLAGARFMVLGGPLARLHRALGQFMLDRQVAAGWQETVVPLLVRDHAMFGTGQLPKFANDLFFSADDPNRRRLLDEALSKQNFDRVMKQAVDEGRSPTSVLNAVLEAADTAEQFWLIPTAEVSLTNLVREQILDAGTLPLRLTALTPCFRSEAGAAGKDTRGLIRQHQFEKVELVTICAPDQSEAEHARMVEAAEAVLEALELPYRRMLLCAGDMGFSARKTYDLEVWLPGAKAYREISSVSNCGDFQARRMDARFKARGDKGTSFVHTLNGSGLAVGRTLVAVLENHQAADGSVTVPQALRPYMGGVETLTPSA